MQVILQPDPKAETWPLPKAAPALSLMAPAASHIRKRRAGLQLSQQRGDALPPAPSRLFSTCRAVPCRISRPRRLSRRAQARRNAPPRPSCQSETARPSAHGVPPHIPKVRLVRLLCTPYSRTARPYLQALQLSFCACGTVTHAEAESGEWRSQSSEAVGECIKFKLNRKNLRRELSGSQQALKEEIKEPALLLSPFPPSPSVLASPEASPSAPQQPPFLSARPLTPHRVGDLGQPCDSQCCSMPSSTRSEKVPFRSGGVSFCRPLSKFRRQEDQEKQSQKDGEK
ncbi:hypothetical protein R6Z07M_013634 [Ovis aries]